MDELIAVGFSGTPQPGSCGVRSLITRDPRSSMYSLLEPERPAGLQYNDDDVLQLERSGHLTRLPVPKPLSAPILNARPVALYCGDSAYREITSIVSAMLGDRVAGNFFPAEPASRTEDGSSVWLLSLENALHQLIRWGDVFTFAVDQYIHNQRWENALLGCNRLLEIYPFPFNDKRAAPVSRAGRLAALLRLGVCYKYNHAWLDRLARSVEVRITPELGIEEEQWSDWIDTILTGIQRRVAIRRRGAGASLDRYSIVSRVGDLLSVCEDGRERNQVAREIVAAAQLMVFSDRDDSLPFGDDAAIAAYRVVQVPSHRPAGHLVKERSRLEHKLRRVLDEVSDEKLARFSHVLHSLLVERVAQRLEGDADIPPSVQRRAIDLLIEILQWSVPFFNLRAATRSGARRVTRSLDVALRELPRLALPACSVHRRSLQDGRTSRSIFVNSGMWKGELLFLTWHEIAHWMLHYLQRDDGGNCVVRDDVFKQKTLTSAEAAEHDANRIAMIAIWPGPSVAFLSMLAARGKAGVREAAIQPPHAHLDAATPEHINLLTRFVEVQYGAIDSTDTDLRARVEYYAKRRLEEYHRYLTTHVFMRSPGLLNWFSEIEADSRREAGILSLLEDDSSCIWGVLSRERKLVRCSPSFCTLIGADEEEIASADLLSDFDDKVPFCRWDRGELHHGVASGDVTDVYSTDLFDLAFSTMERVVEPLVYYVIYRTRHLGGKARVLCRLQTIPIVAPSPDDSGKELTRSLALVEPQKLLLVNEDEIRCLTAADLGGSDLAKLFHYGMNRFKEQGGAGDNLCPPWPGE